MPIERNELWALSCPTRGPSLAEHGTNAKELPEADYDTKRTQRLVCPRA